MSGLGVDVLAVILGYLGICLLVVLLVVACALLGNLGQRIRVRRVRRALRRYGGRVAGVGVPQDPAKPVLIVVDPGDVLGPGDDSAAPRH